MNEQTAMLTVADAIEYAEQAFLESDIFLGHGSLEPYDEAVYLVLYAIGMPPFELEPYLDQFLTNAQKNKITELTQRRIHERLPAAYLSNESWLMGRRFYVDQRVIIPRSLIAEVLTHSIDTYIPDLDQIQHVLDMCTGSGCLAILAAETFPQASVDAVDLSADALEVAKRNVHDYHLQDYLNLYQSDLFTALPPKQYDLIISNPPYVNAESMANLPDEYLHEPNMALAGGTDGMDLVRRILAQAADYLSPQGILILEIGHERPFFDAAFAHLNPIWLSTSGGEDQVLLLTKTQLQQDTP